MSARGPGTRQTAPVTENPFDITGSPLEILRAAERLFASRGVDAVSLREISVAAGHRNHSAAQYHFQDKIGLVDALLLRHSSQVQARWIEIIDAMRDQGDLSLPVLVELLVRSVAEKIDDVDGGQAFILISAQLVAHPTLSLLERHAVMTEPPLALAQAMLECIAVPPDLVAPRMERVAGVMYASLSSYVQGRVALSR